MIISESYLYLRLKQIAVFAFIPVAESVLCLQPALGIEPILQSGYIIGLFPTDGFVCIEIVIRSHKVEIA